MLYLFPRHILVFFTASILVLFFCVSFFKIYQVQEDSMEPQLYNGQKIVTIRSHSLRNGDIVVFENPEDHRLVVKRCILSPGEPVVVQNNILITPKANIPLTVRQESKLARYSFIPENMFFATGDNTFNSHDSRDYGPVTLENLKGKVLLF